MVFAFDVCRERKTKEKGFMCEYVFYICFKVHLFEHDITIIILCLKLLHLVEGGHDSETLLNWMSSSVIR